jgi:hypothetical protein
MSKKSDKKRKKAKSKLLFGKYARIALADDRERRGRQQMAQAASMSQRWRDEIERRSLIPQRLHGEMSSWQPYADGWDVESEMLADVLEPGFEKPSGCDVLTTPKRCKGCQAYLTNRDNQQFDYCSRCVMADLERARGEESEYEIWHRADCGSHCRSLPSGVMHHCNWCHSDNPAYRFDGPS